MFVTFFFPLPSIFLFFFFAPNVFCQFVFSQAVSAGAVSAAGPRAQAQRWKTVRTRACARAFSQETDLILCSQIGGHGAGGGRMRSHSLTKTSSPPLIIETGSDCLFGNSFSNRCNDND